MARPERLLEGAFKLKFGLKLCLFTLMGGTAVVFFLYLALSRSLGTSYASAIYTIYELKIKVAPLIFASSYSVVLLALVTAAIAAISLIYSHRIAGPIYRLERNLEAISEGDLTVSTRFRGNDQLSALAVELNAMVRSLNHTSRTVMDALEDIREAHDRCARLVAMKDAPEGELRAAAEALRAAVIVLNRSLSHVKVGK